MSDLTVQAVSATAPEGTRRVRGGIPYLQIFCLLVLVFVVLCAIFGSLVAPHDPSAQNLLLSSSNPSTSHWFGTDTLGRDIFSRIIAGVRTALIGPALIAVGAMTIGSVFGMLAGFYGGKRDTWIMRAVDLMWAIPGLLVAIVVVGVIGGGYWNAVTVLIILTAPWDVRLIRGAVLEQRPRPYVEAVRALGLPARKVMYRHIWPNVVPVVVANTFLAFAQALVALAALSFLGLGVPPGTADWGLMLSENRALLFQNPVAALAPGIALVIVATATNLLGDFSYETLADRGRAK
jgi:peptide/nickel transport system permease protein